MLRQIHYGRYITSVLSQQPCDGKYIRADILWQSYCGTTILWQTYYGKYIMATMLRQMYSGMCITADILLHPKPLVATHHSKGSPGPLYAVYVENGALFVRPQGRHGRAPSSQEGMDGHGRKESAQGAPGSGSLLYIVYVALSHLLSFSECALGSKTMSAVPRSRHRLLRCTADMSAV